jgi:hypothetical protein
MDAADFCGIWLADQVPTVAKPGGCWPPRSSSEREEIATCHSRDRDITVLNDRDKP